MVSIKDIAARCGVSVATVSKALNGHTDVSASTRTAVRKAASDMGYLPNSAARALKTRRTYNLGVLFVDDRQSGLAHEYFSGLLDSFKVEAESHGYDITFINRNVGGRRTSYLEHCRYRCVDGALIASVNFSDPEVLELLGSNLPVVTIDHTFNNRTTILSDNFDGIRALVQYIYEMGHRRIAFIHGENTSVTESRMTGFYRTCYDLGIEVPDEYVCDGVYHDFSTCAQHTRELMALKEPPTCILFPDDFSALGGYNALAEMGLKIPQDISVVGYDGILLSQLVMPPLVTYRQNTAALGKNAARQLIDLIEQPRITLPECITVHGELLEGGSVARR